MILVVWGVSGCGKTTIGQQVATHLGWQFYDADDFHPSANVEKMRAGQPLTDEDRWPWLARLAELLEEHVASQQSAVLACSALRKIYREKLDVNAKQVQFVQLAGSFTLIRDRLAARNHEFMDPALLQSQFDTLEEDPVDWRVEIDAAPESVCDAITSRIGSQSSS